MQNLILITGASGYLGQATFRAALAAGYPVAGTYHRHHPALSGRFLAALDIGRPDAVRLLIAALRPAAIVHTAAAWNTVEEAEKTIVEGTRTLVAAAADAGSRLIHLSTDMIFDGEHAPYRESDAPVPLAYYGRAKAEAEAIVAGGLADHVIVRTSLITCLEPPDPRTLLIRRALETMAHEPDENAAAGARRHLTLFTDEYRCPVRLVDLAAALVELIGHPYRGVLNVAGPDRLSRYQIGQIIARAAGLSPDPIIPGTAAGSGMVRPRDCTLDISLAQAVLRTALRPITVP